jgi:hypothetical protein
MSDAVAPQPAYAAAIHRAVATGDALPHDCDVLERALTARVATNLTDADAEVDLEHLENAALTVVRQWTSQRTESLLPHDVSSEAQINQFVDSLCEKVHLPWPLCAARA